MQKGNIGVTTENIFPIIKKFLYSDHEIFLRELVSNAVDATQKLNTLASIGEFKGELGDLTVHVELGKDTITISDRGIGLTAEEIEKYINQIAFSGANDFLEKYKNDANAIIGSLYAMGYSPDDMVELLKSEDFKRWYSGEVEEKYVYHFKKNLPTPEFFNIRFSFKDSLKSLKPQFLPTSVVNPIQMNLVFVDLYARATAA